MYLTGFQCVKISIINPIKQLEAIDPFLAKITQYRPFKVKMCYLKDEIIKFLCKYQRLKGFNFRQPFILMEVSEEGGEMLFVFKSIDPKQQKFLSDQLKIRDYSDLISPSRANPSPLVISFNRLHEFFDEILGMVCRLRSTF